jgi:hypothetical protein
MPASRSSASRRVQLMGNEANRSPQVAVSRRASQICGDERIPSIKMQLRLSSVTVATANY